MALTSSLKILDCVVLLENQSVRTKTGVANLNSGSVLNPAMLPSFLQNMPVVTKMLNEKKAPEEEGTSDILLLKVVVTKIITVLQIALAPVTL